MRSEYIALLLAAGIGLGIAVSPTSIKTAVAERVAVPENVVAELSRQMNFFASWANQDGQAPDANEDDSIIVVEEADA
ncbi:MAG: hypothetical protein P8P99_09265 [Maricaulis sp.]|jgi:hypothetical protein|nr:hypothetical protein [Maricaulis sp.]